MKRKFIFLAISLFGILLCMPAMASERKEVCAKYQRQDGTYSDSYKVQATVLPGYELEEKTGSYTYQPYSTYVVIFWSQNEATIIELSYTYLTYMDQDGEDQEGRTWEVSESSGACF